MQQETVGARILRLAKSTPELADLGHEALAKRFGVEYESLRKWVVGPGVPRRTRAERIALLLHVPVETIMYGVNYIETDSDGALLVQEVTQGKTHTRVAQSVSQQSVKVASKSIEPTIVWRDMKMLAALKRFCVVAPDDSMAPIILEGMTVIFDRTFEARNRDTVLIKDSAGKWYIRTYREAPGGRWEAKAEHSDYAPMYSERDGLEVLAVYDGTRGRRG